MSTRQSVEDVNLSTCQHVIKFQISRSVKCHEVINFLSSFQELLVFFAIFCQLLPFFLHLFGTFLYFCQFWHCLATFGILWQLFAIFLQLLPGFDSFEQFFAMFWQPLTILGKFGYFWQLLANLSFSGQILIFLPAFGCSHKLWATFMNFLWLSPLFGNICQC